MKDEAFIRGKVPMTKEEVRILTLDGLDLAQARTLIDVGAGTGSVCIEACMRFPQLRALAIEKNPEGVELIQQNAEKFGVRPQLEIIAGFAPLELPVQQADAIFIGGSGGSLAEIIRWAYDLLIPGGRMVLNFILLNNLNEGLAELQHYEFARMDVTEIQISRLTALGKGHYFKPNNPTFMAVCVKPE